MPSTTATTPYRLDESQREEHFWNLQKTLSLVSSEESLF